MFAPLTTPKQALALKARKAISYPCLTLSMPKGLPEEIEALKASYKHLVTLRDEVIGVGVLHPLAQWSSVNPNL